MDKKVARMREMRRWGVWLCESGTVFMVLCEVFDREERAWSRGVERD